MNGRVLPKRTWWLSFADREQRFGEQFKGVMIVPEAESLQQAIELARAAGCKPEWHGTGTYVSDPVELMQRVPTMQLLTRADLERCGFLAVQGER